MTLVAEAALAGLVGSPHCVGMCGGFAGLAADAPVGYHAGRLTTYALLGALAGTVGSIIPGPPWVSAAVAAAMVLWFSARLAGLLPEKHMPALPGVTRAGAWLAGREGIAGRYALGAVTALLPCGLVWAALGLAVASGHPGTGALAMLAFGAGTIPLLGGLAVGLRTLAARGRGARLALAALVLVVGLWSIGTRTAAASHDADEPPSCHDAEPAPPGV